MHRRWWLCAALLALAGCGGADKPAARHTPVPEATVTAGATAKPTPTPIPLTVADEQLCAPLYARLQRVTLAISSSSELITQAKNPAELSRRIATEQQQLERSARLMAAATVPAPLSVVNDRMVRALRRFSRDFGRAHAPAARGDFTTAVAAMTDRPTVNRIIAAAGTIQRACQP